MSSPIVPERRQAFAARMARAVLLADPLRFDPQLIDAAAGRVADQIAAMPDVTRAGVRVAEGVSRVTLAILALRSFARLTDIEQAALLNSPALARTPLVREYVALVRSLALVGVHA